MNHHEVLGREDDHRKGRLTMAHGVAHFDPDRRAGTRALSAGSWAVIVSGITAAVLLAACLTAIVKLQSLNETVADIAKRLVEKTAAEELARTRYEALAHSIDEVKRKEDQAAAWYHDDVRRGFTPKR